MTSTTVVSVAVVVTVISDGVVPYFLSRHHRLDLYSFVPGVGTKLGTQRLGHNQFSPTNFVRTIREQKWLILKASTLGFAMFELLGVAVRYVAAEVDRALFTNVSSSVRALLLQCRAWELYRAFLYCIAGAFTGWTVTRVYRSHRRVAVAGVAVVLGISLLISLFTGPGYYLRDFVLIVGITLSPLFGLVVSRSQEHRD